jgi:hypothetical protein
VDVDELRILGAEDYEKHSNDEHQYQDNDPHQCVLRFPNALL